MPTVAVIVPARDAAATLAATLDALAAQTVPAEVVVVDNGSQDATAALAQAHPAVDRVVQRARGAGPGAARNDGAAATRAEVLAFTDSDCVPVPGWLAAGLDALGGADLVQGRVDPDPAGDRHPFEHTVSVSGAYGLFETANLFVRRAWFERLGGFGPGIPAPGRPFAEDVFFGWEARRAGARTAFSDAALVHHAVLQRPASAFVDERRRLRHFPPLVREVPELRTTFLRRGLFLTEQTLAFDGALAGLVAAALARRALPLAAALPYALRVRRITRHWPQHPAGWLAAVTVAADAVGAASLAAGSLRARRAVL